MNNCQWRNHRKDARSFVILTLHPETSNPPTRSRYRRWKQVTLLCTSCMVLPMQWAISQGARGLKYRLDSVTHSETSQTDMWTTVRQSRGDKCTMEESSALLSSDDSVSQSVSCPVCRSVRQSDCHLLCDVIVHGVIECVYKTSRIHVVDCLLEGDQPAGAQLPTITHHHVSVTTPQHRQHALPYKPLWPRFCTLLQNRSPG
jgi:hypothetical protein